MDHLDPIPFSFGMRWFSQLCRNMLNKERLELSKLHSACLRKIMQADYEILASKKLQWSILLQILEAASKNYQLF